MKFVDPSQIAQPWFAVTLLVGGFLLIGLPSSTLPRSGVDARYA